MWLTALTTQAKESVGHLDLVAIWLWPKICRTDLGFSVPACNLDLGQLDLNWTDRFHTVTRSVYWLELDLPRISRFHHLSLRHHSEVRSCRWDQNPTEFAGDPGVHRPSPGAFGDLEVFFGRWLEGFRYLPDRVVVNPTQSQSTFKLHHIKSVKSPPLKGERRWMEAEDVKDKDHQLRCLSANQQVEIECFWKSQEIWF